VKPPLSPNAVSSKPWSAKPFMMRRSTAHRAIEWLFQECNAKIVAKDILGVKT